MLSTLLMVLFLICAVFMILLILVQKGRGGGLAAAFGGGGAQSAFGTKTADVLTKMTTYTAIVFFLISVVMAIYLKPSAGAGQQQPSGDTEQKTPADNDGNTPAAPATPAAPTAPASDAGTEPSSD